MYYLMVSVDRESGHCLAELFASVSLTGYSQVLGQDTVISSCERQARIHLQTHSCGHYQDEVICRLLGKDEVICRLQPQFPADSWLKATSVPCHGSSL